MDLKRSLAVLAALAALAALAGCAEGEPAATTPVPERSAQPAPREQPEELVAVRLDDFDRGVRGFAKRLPLCTTLAQALELALAADCVAEAYAGIDRSPVAAPELDGAPPCRSVLRDYVRRLRRFHEWAADTTAAARNRQFFDFNTLAAEARRQTSRYERARARVSACTARGGG